MDSNRSSGIQDFQEIVRTYYGRVCAFCRTRLCSFQDAEDAVQETFSRGFIHYQRNEPIQSVGGWLQTIAHHVCVDTIRRNVLRQTAPLLDGHLSIESQDKQKFEQRDEHQMLMDAIFALEEPLREVVLLHYFDALTYDEMADWLGVARSTINERLSKARRLLKCSLSTHGVQP